MTDRIRFYLIIVVGVITACSHPKEKNELHLILNSYVNPFVGTSGFGNVYPGAQVSFGGGSRSAPIPIATITMPPPVINTITPL